MKILCLGSAIRYTILLVLCFLAAACGKEEAEGVPRAGPEVQSAGALDASTDITRAAINRAPMTEEEKISYILGINLANGVPVEVLQLDKDFVLLGIEDVQNKKVFRMSEMELQRTMHQLKLSIQEYNEKQQRDLQEKHNIKNSAIEEAGEKLLQVNKEKDGIQQISSGVQYRIVQQGSGNKPNADSKIRVHYAVSFVDDKNQLQEFDSSYKRGAPSTFAMEEVIPGWQEVLPMMSEGSHWQLFVPANMAYGLPGITGGEIPATATLVYELELVEVVSGL